MLFDTLEFINAGVVSAPFKSAEKTPLGGIRNLRKDILARERAKRACCQRGLVAMHELTARDEQDAEQVLAEIHKDWLAKAIGQSQVNRTS